MHEPKASVLSARDCTANWYINNLALFTDLRQTSTRLGVLWKRALEYSHVIALEESDSSKVT